VTSDVPHIPGFLLLRRIGRGGMGDVWLGKQEGSGVPVAMKLMHEESSEEQRRQSEREAVASLNIHHENVVATVAIGRVDGRPWIAMEYASGGNLAARVRKAGPLGEREAIRVGLDAARGLREAARAGVVHRDVKPQNLLFDGEDRIKVCDLGLVSETGDAAANLRAGTPRFMAPEQLLTDGKIDHRTDIYALGGTLFFAVTGRAAVDGGDPTEVVRQQLRVALPDPRALVPGLSDGFVNVLRRMTEKDPRDRYQLWDELIIDLEHLERGASPLSAAIAVAKRTSVRRRWLAPALLAVVALAGAVVLALALVGPNGEPSGTVDPREAEARGRLLLIDEELSRGAGAAQAVGQYRELVLRYPETEAAKLAEDRAREIESRTAAGFARAYRATTLAVRTLTREGKLEAARTAIEEAGPMLSAADVVRLEELLKGRVEEVGDSVRNSFRSNLARGDLAAARVVIEETEDTDLAGLRTWRREAVEQLAGAEARRIEERREAARLRYEKSVADALLAAREGRGADGRQILDRAAAQGGALLGDLPETDRRILGLIALARARAVRRGKELIGKPVAVVRDGEIFVGRLDSLSPHGLRLKGIDEVLRLDQLDAATFRGLASGAAPTALAAFALARGDAREVSVRLSGIDSVLATRLRDLAGDPPEPMKPVPTEGGKEGETPAAAADRLASEGRHAAAFRLDPKVRERFPGRDPAAARTLSDCGLDLYVTSKLAEAIVSFRSAIGMDPFDGDARLHLARALLVLASRNRSPVLLDRIAAHLHAGETFRPDLPETKRLRRVLEDYRRR